MTARERRHVLRWTALVAVLFASGGVLLALAPRSGGAQMPPVSRADQVALDESKAGLDLVRSQVAAMTGLPPEVTRLTARISAAVQAQEREVLAGNKAAARRRHEETAQALKRLGAVLQRHLAPPAEQQVDAAILAEHFARLSERHHLLAGLAAEPARPVVDLGQVAQAEVAAQAALSGGATPAARTSLEAYLVAIEALEDALFLRSQRLAP